MEQSLVHMLVILITPNLKNLEQHLFIVKVIGKVNEAKSL